MKKLIFTFYLFLPFSLLAQDYTQQLESLENYIEQGRKDWSLPGMAIAIVKDGEILMAEGFGEKKIGSGDKVNSKTIFNIGSTTKAFTAALIGMLVDEGKVDWDAPVIEHLPQFALYDADATRKARVKDLLTHNLGLGNADALWANANFSSEEILHRMRYLAPAYAFRGGYTYQNIMYLAAGLLIEEVTGKSWETNIEERIFKPLGMENSYANKALSQVESNRSIAHHWAEEKVIPIADFNCDSIAAAGAIWSCVDDLAKWSLLMLNEGKVGNKVLLEEDTWAMLFKPHALIPPNQFYPTTAITKPKWTSYGLGWFQHDYFGKDLDFHTGSLPGTIAMHGLIHEEKLGFYFLGNLDHAELRHALMYKVFDTFGNTGNERDWSQDLKAFYDMRNANADLNRTNFIKARKTDSQPSKAMKDYVGTYSHPVWGKMSVTLENNQLMIVDGKERKQRLEHWHYETFQIQPNEAWRFPSYLTFHINTNGQVAVLSLGEGYEYTKE